MNCDCRSRIGNIFELAKVSWDLHHALLFQTPPLDQNPPPTGFGELSYLHTSLALTTLSSDQMQLSHYLNIAEDRKQASGRASTLSGSTVTGT